MAEKIDPTVKEIWDALVSDASLAMSKALSAEAAARDLPTKAQIKEAKVSVEIQQGKLDDAESSASEMLALCQRSNDARGQAKALLCVAQVLNAKGNMDDALSKADEALVACGESSSQSNAWRGKMSIYLANRKYREAKNEAQHAVSWFHEAGDLEGEGSAQLMLAEACISNNSHGEASLAAREALFLYKSKGDVSGQGAALMAIITAEMEDVNGSAVQAAEERLALFKDKGNSLEEAQSQLALAGAYVGRLAKKLLTCTLASLEDSLGAIKAAGFAYDGFRSENNWEGQDACMREVYRTLTYNNVPGDMIETIKDPHEALDHITAGSLTNAKNAFPLKKVGLSKDQKLEDIIPSARQLERTKFAWTRPHEDSYSFTLIWQPVKDRENAAPVRPRGSYEVLTTCTGSTNMMATPNMLLKGHDTSERGGKPMVVFMVSPDCYWNYMTSILALTNVYAALAASNLKFVSCVQMNESHQDMATAFDNRMRCCGLHECTLGIIRQARYELPNVASGFVSGDVASWISDPIQIIENIFDSVEGEEFGGECIFRRSDAYEPLLVHRPLEHEEINIVKPNKGTGSRW
mmetsp:Transcript_109903/g.234663  ORF Transcript_109903/g.234663 Transcript_109903/m.234663 type:complete len:580 (-) Transcript_109903:193-1932(-)